MQKPDPQMWSLSQSVAAKHAFGAGASSSTTFSACTKDEAVNSAKATAANRQDIAQI